MMRYLLTILVLLVGIEATALAQVDRKDVRRGNRDFKKENYREADIDYRKALVKDSLSVAANYNLANNLYRQKDMEQSKATLERIGEIAPEMPQAADYYFNKGDVAIAMEDWQSAVDAFEQSLLRNPGDMQAKENYIYAKKKLQDQQNQQNQNQDQQNQDNQDQNNDQNQNDQNNQDQQNDQNQDDQNKDQNDDQNDQQQDQNNDQNKQDQQNQGQQPKISPQAAQQMLQAIQAKEKETQDKVNKQKAEALKSRQKEKNW